MSWGCGGVWGVLFVYTCSLTSWCGPPGSEGGIMRLPLGVESQTPSTSSK